MKRFLLFAFAAVIMAAGCKKYDDTDLQNRVGSLENRVAKLEELCKQLNSDISSLRTIVTALQNNDYVTGVIPVVKNGETVGYTITFSKSSPITIYHGENGKDGADGKDGYTPQIGVRQDADGIWYWTLDGEWLTDGSGNKIKAEGRDGKDGANGKDGADGNDGQNGKDGANGSDGKDGKDGITPRLKIEDGWWWVSYDNEQSWEKLGKATGNDGSDGENGKDGENGNNGSSGGNGSNGSDGDSFFKDVDTTSSDEYVIFTLADGTQIKLPTWYAFEQLKLLCNQMNTNIESLQKIVAALEKKDYIVSCTPLMEDGRQIGYTITFAKSGAITIYHGKDGAAGNDGAAGKDGHSPKVGAKKDSDGKYYWTLDGEWMTDDEGQKIPVTGDNGSDGDNGAAGNDGLTPRFKIEDGYWYITYDEGDDNWQQLGKATGENGENGKDGDSFFESVTEDEDYIHIKLSDSDETIDIPKYKPLEITFADTEDILVRPAQIYKIAYTITGADDKTVVKTMTQDGYRAAVEASSESAGTIIVTTPSMIVPSEVLVFVSNGKGQTIMRSINFVADVIVITDKTYYVGKEAQTLEVEVLTNLDYAVEIAEDAKAWVSLAPQSRAILRTDRLAFTIQANETAEKRTALVEFKSEETTVESIMIIQHASTLETTDVPKAGSLEERLAEAGVDTKTLEELKVTGHLNIFDYEYIKTLPNLKTLDLSELDDAELPTGCLEASKISTVLLPRNLRKINNRAFYGAAITFIEIPETVEWIGDYAFYNCISIKGDLVIPDATTHLGASCFQKCTFDGILDLGQGVETIGEYAFAEASKFTGNLIIPESTTTLGKYAFSQSGFTGNLVVGNNVTDIPEYCFYNCTKFAGTIKLGNNITAINEAAFYGCTKFTGNLVIPDAVKTIAKEAFGSCTGFKGYLTIGSGVQTIGRDSFSDVSATRMYYALNFSKIYCKATTPPSAKDFSLKYSFGEYTRSGSTWKGYLGVPVGCKSAYTKTGWGDFSTIEEVEFD